MRGLGGTSRSHHVRPPSYLARAVGALEGLLLEEHREAVLRSHLLEDLPQGRGRGEVGRQRHRKVTNSCACTGQPPAPRRACITTTFWSVCVVTEPNIAADEKRGRPEKETYALGTPSEASEAHPCAQDARANSYWFGATSWGAA